MRTCSSGLHALYTFRKPTPHCGDIAQLLEQTDSSPNLVLIIASEEGEVDWRGIEEEERRIRKARHLSGMQMGKCVKRETET